MSCIGWWPIDFALLTGDFPMGNMAWSTTAPKLHCLYLTGRLSASAMLPGSSVA
jgi:hypothetical protein